MSQWKIRKKSRRDGFHRPRMRPRGKTAKVSPSLNAKCRHCGNSEPWELAVPETGIKVERRDDGVMLTETPFFICVHCAGQPWSTPGRYITLAVLADESQPVCAVVDRE